MPQSVTSVVVDETGGLVLDGLGDEVPSVPHPATNARTAAVAMIVGRLIRMRGWLGTPARLGWRARPEPAFRRRTSVV